LAARRLRSGQPDTHARLHWLELPTSTGRQGSCSSRWVGRRRGGSLHSVIRPTNKR